MRFLLYACFFLSGFSSLIYETLWTRSLTHVIGGSPYAVSIILTVFMGGLGLGGALGGRVADRLRAPSRLLMGYGLLEMAVGLYALVLPGLLSLMAPAFSATYGRLFGAPFAYNAAVFVLAAIPVLLPILCMGATLPILGRFQVRSQDKVGGALGFLYGLNTLGAAAGVAAAGFWLLPTLGLRGSTLLAAAVNGAVGILCVILGRRLLPAEAAAVQASSGPPGVAKALPPASTSPAAPARASNPDSGARPSPAAKSPASNPKSAAVPSAAAVPPAMVRAALALFALSGFCAMAYEVIWTKVLSLIMGPTTYAFTTVLVAFIAGLALGGWAFARLADRVRNPALLLALLQGAAALLALAAGHRMGNSLFLFEKIDYLHHADFGSSLLLKGLFLFAFMLPPTLLLGGTFPLVMRLFARAGDGLGRSIGWAYAANTFGGVLGSWSAGFLLVPLLGSETSLGLLAALQAAAALAFAWMALRGRASRQPHGEPLSPGLGALRLRLGLAAGAAIAALLCSAYPRWDRQVLGRAASRILGPELKEASWSDAVWNQRPVIQAPLPETQVYYGDGIGGFTAVWKNDDLLGGHDFSLFVSGKADASTRRDMFTQVLLAHVPMLLHPDPRSVMVLGLASGVTAGEALRYPLEHLDVLEINPQVIEASGFFRPWNGGVLADPRTRLLLQDAKAHLLLSDRRYDVIISEPSNPWMAGLSELFSREFFERARDRLTDEGVIVQFLHSYSMDWGVFSMVGRTFAEVFPNSMLVRTMPDDRRLPGSASDFLLVGARSGKPLAFLSGEAKARALASSPNIRLADPGLFYRLVEAENLKELFGEGPLHTDDRPLLEFAAPKLRFTYDSRAIESALAAGGRLRDSTRARVSALKSDPVSRLDFGDFALSLYKPFPGMLGSQDSSDRKNRFADRLEAYCAANHVTDLDFLEDPSLRMRCSVAQMAVLGRQLKSGSGADGPVYLAMADLCLMNGIIPNAVKYLQKAIEFSGEYSMIGRQARLRMDQVRAAAGASVAP